MRKKATILALLCIIITGCSINQHCDAYSDQQCDEMYPYYNCDHPQMYSYTTRNYKKYIRNNSYTPGYNGYYPNTQTIYYTPLYINQNCNSINTTQLQRSPRPTQLGGDIGLPTRKPQENAPVRRVRN
jgi:hypothetical protein